MKKFIVTSIMVAFLAAAKAGAAEGPVPGGIPALEHVFVIMMENHVYGQIAMNPQAPFINGLMGSANLATNYFAIAHPCSTNYLEVTGGPISTTYPTSIPTGTTRPARRTCYPA